jgi:hypothetical protein
MGHLGNIYHVPGNVHLPTEQKLMMKAVQTSGQATDLVEPVRVGYANKVLKGKQLCHLSGRIIPNSLQNELALADLG